MLNIDEMLEEVKSMMFDDTPVSEIKEMCKRNEIELVTFEVGYYDGGFDGLIEICSFVLRDKEGNIRTCLNNINYLG